MTADPFDLTICKKAFDTKIKPSVTNSGLDERDRDGLAFRPQTLSIESSNTLRIDGPTKQDKQSGPFPAVATKEDYFPRRKRIIQEIISSERSYVTSLTTALDVYFRSIPLEPRPCLTNAELLAIFSNLEAILELNTQILKALLEEAAKPDDKRRIGSIFTQFLPRFSIYNFYVSHYPEAIELHNQKLKTKDDYRAFCVAASASARCRLLSLTSYLIMPVQRLPRYKMLINQLLEATPATHADFEVLCLASNKIERTVVTLNEDIRVVERQESIARLEKEFLEDPQFLSSNAAPNRQLIKRGTVQRRSNSKIKNQIKSTLNSKLSRSASASAVGYQIYLFLFSDMLALADRTRVTNGRTLNWKYTLISKAQLDSKFAIATARELRMGEEDTDCAEDKVAKLDEDAPKCRGSRFEAQLLMQIEGVWQKMYCVLVSVLGSLELRCYQNKDDPLVSVIVEMTPESEVVNTVQWVKVRFKEVAGGRLIASSDQENYLASPKKGLGVVSSPGETRSDASVSGDATDPVSKTTSEKVRDKFKSSLSFKRVASLSSISSSIPNDKESQPSADALSITTVSKVYPLTLNVSRETSIQVATESEKARGDWFINLKLALEGTSAIVREGSVRRQAGGMVKRWQNVHAVVTWKTFDIYRSERRRSVSSSQDKDKEPQPEISLRITRHLVLREELLPGGSELDRVLIVETEYQESFRFRCHSFAEHNEWLRSLAMVAESHRNPPSPASRFPQPADVSLLDDNASRDSLINLFRGDGIERRKVDNVIWMMTGRNLEPSMLTDPNGRDRKRVKVDPWQHRALMKVNGKLMVIEGESEEEIQDWVNAIRGCEEEQARERLEPMKYRNPQACLNFTSISSKFRVCILGLKNVNAQCLPGLDGTVKCVYVKNFLFYGTSVLGGTMCCTKPQDVADCHTAQGMLATHRSIKKLPRETRIAFLICGNDINGKERVLGWVMKPLVNEKGFLLAGQHMLRVWANTDLIEGGGKKKSKKSAPNKQPAQATAETLLSPGISEMRHTSSKVYEKKYTADLAYYMKLTPGDCTAMGEDIAVISCRFDSWEKPVYAPRVLTSAVHVLKNTAAQDTRQAQSPTAQSEPNSPVPTYMVLSPRGGLEPKTFAFTPTIKVASPEPPSDNSKSKVSPIKEEEDSHHFVSLRERSLDGAKLEELVKRDLLKSLTQQEKHNLWQERESLMKLKGPDHFKEASLVHLLRCVDWNSPLQIEQSRDLLSRWRPFPRLPSTALQLLDASFPDFTVRKFAVDILRGVSDEELVPYLLQLTQCLKFEPYHTSELSNFLVERSASKTSPIGHYWFWHMRAEMQTHESFRERASFVLEEYFAKDFSVTYELSKQLDVVSRLQKVAEKINSLKDEKKKEEISLLLRAELHHLNQTFFNTLEGERFQYPLDPSIYLTNLSTEDCKFMKSKKCPLWLVFNRADGEGKVTFLFKSGDDLRQDILTLQLLKVFDNIWKANGLDLHLKP
eukprot:g65302.t1